MRKIKTEFVLILRTWRYLLQSSLTLSQTGLGKLFLLAALVGLVVAAQEGLSVAFAEPNTGGGGTECTGQSEYYVGPVGSPICDNNNGWTVQQHKNCLIGNTSYHLYYEQVPGNPLKCQKNETNPPPASQFACQSAEKTGMCAGLTESACYSNAVSGCAWNQTGANHWEGQCSCGAENIPPEEKNCISYTVTSSGQCTGGGKADASIIFTNNCGSEVAKEITVNYTGGSSGNCPVGPNNTCGACPVAEQGKTLTVPAKQTRIASESCSVSCGTCQVDLAYGSQHTGAASVSTAGCATPPPPPPPPPPPVQQTVICDSIGLNPNSGSAPLTMTMTVNGHTENGGSVASYQFNFGDGSTTVSQPENSASHTYVNPGIYTLRGYVTDNIDNTVGGSGSCQGSVTVSQPPVTYTRSYCADNACKVATCNPSDQPCSSSCNKDSDCQAAAQRSLCDSLSVSPDTGTGVPLTVNAQLAGHTENGGSVVSYRFNFGDNTADVNQSTNSTSHTYNNLGTYLINGYVIDDRNNVSGSCQRTVRLYQPQVLGVTNPPVMPKTGPEAGLLLALTSFGAVGVILGKAKPSWIRR